MSNQDIAWYARYFRFTEHGTNLRTEILAGVTTFFTMAYIFLVNPSILSKTGMNFGAVFVATVIASIIGTLLMGLLANYPIALAPGMGLNAYFTYTVVLGMKVPWQTALGAVFISGLIFLLLTATKVREMIINAIPSGLKYSISAGIGFFIAFIGLKNAAIIVPSEATIVSLSPHFASKSTWLVLFGLLVTVILVVRKVKGAIFIGMVLTAIVGMLSGQIKPPTQFFSLPPSIKPTLLQLDLASTLELGLVTIVFAFLFVDLFDNAGTLVGVTTQAGLLKDGKLPRAGKALVTDSIATMSGAALGTSTVTSYIESTSGVASGGRTGMTSVATAFCMLLSLFCFPLVERFASVSAITAPALIIVGVLMANSLRKIEWEDLTEAIPAFVTVIAMPLTSSIATGISLGFILYPLCKVVVGKWKAVHPIVYILGVLFILRFIFLEGI
ncbi:putative MFS transporter, AGZA family, xanthine/uracil permease [Seinonella peptonophila]|uniref:Putative MFS transporter, AGZA family, xanthine/uracil permease n=1 Tax=Seinonella peptonophila TaxID=112248 RepID=A0A1M4Y3A4_9BACL|nr:NCS2 family permease [Seinonella peptonophila]SHF00053.1 putative MFS transporter, AGZA family, xanthine/uracil permease [Seinonella peptonophila]